MPTLMPPPTPSPPAAPEPPAPPTAWLLAMVVLLDGHDRATGEVDATAHAGGARHARIAGAAASHVVGNHAAGHEARRDEDQGDAASFGEWPAPARSRQPPDCR